MRGDPRYIDALPSTMTTTSQNGGNVGAAGRRRAEQRQIWGTCPESCTSLKKMRPACRRPGNMSIWSVIRAPAESTR